VRRVLEEQRDVEICGEAVNGNETIQKIRELNPDVVILDIRMPVLNGFEAARLIRKSEEAPQNLWKGVEAVVQRHTFFPSNLRAINFPPDSVACAPS
jgi:DNA-binding NarL/FixJ family response regulator